MRLLWLIDSLNLGGAERLVVTFAAAARGRFDLTICALKTIGGNPIEKTLRERGVEVVNLEARNLRDIGALRRLGALIRERRIEIVHAHLTYAAIWGALAARRAGIPLIVTLHSAPVAGKPWSRDRVRQTLMASLLRRLAARVIFVSQDQADAFIARRLLPCRKIAVVRNGVALVAPRSASPIETPPLIGTAAVFREGKDIDVLLRAFRLVLDDLPEARLTIAGEGPLRAKLEEEAAALGLGSSVRWLGYRDDIPTLVGSFDLFVHPARSDTLPTTILEAMAAGVPVIASASGGMPEIITDGRDGLLVPPGDEAALAAAIIRLLRHRTLLREMGAAAHARIEGEFSAERWVERLETMYRDAIERGRGSP